MILKSSMIDAGDCSFRFDRCELKGEFRAAKRNHITCFRSMLVDDITFSSSVFTSFVVLAGSRCPS